MESDSNYGGSSSSRIQNLVEDLGDESFETRNEALMTLKAMLPHSEVSISKSLVEIVGEHGDDEAGSSTSFVNKGAIELFQNMSELGLEPLVNDLLRNGDEYARRVATDAYSFGCPTDTIWQTSSSSKEMVSHMLWRTFCHSSRLQKERMESCRLHFTQSPSVQGLHGTN